MATEKVAEAMIITRRVQLEAQKQLGVEQVRREINTRVNIFRFNIIDKSLILIRVGEEEDVWLRLMKAE